MPPRAREPTRAQVSHGLSYVAQKPAFLTNFGRPPPSDEVGRDGRALPSRPRDGKWAAGSDGEGGEKADEEEEDEWEAMYGGGEDGPQVVVLKDKHLNQDEVERLRRRAKGEKTPPPKKSEEEEKEEEEALKALKKPIVRPPTTKRKLLGEATTTKDDKDKPKKKKKASKVLLSFDETEGE